MSEKKQTVREYLDDEVLKCQKALDEADKELDSAARPAFIAMLYQPQYLHITSKIYDLLRSPAGELRERAATQVSQINSLRTMLPAFLKALSGYLDAYSAHQNARRRSQMYADICEK